MIYPTHLDLSKFACIGQTIQGPWHNDFNS